MLESILENRNLIFYVMAAEGVLFCILQIRAVILLKKLTKVKAPAVKKEQTEQLREEVKNGRSEIPVVKFERPKNEEKKKTAEPEKTPEKRQDMEEEEMVVLQELMTEFFG